MLNSQVRATVKTFITGVLLLSGFGCTSLNSVSITQIPAERSQKVQVQKEKFIFLGFTFDNDFVDDSVESLKRQCPNGKISGLLTKDEDVNYFLYIFWKKRLTATGFCVKGLASEVTRGKPRGTASDGKDEVGTSNE